MTSTIRHITIDCHDHHLLARFWAAVLGYPENPNGPNDPESLLIDPKGLQPGLLLPVPEPKTVRNRMHSTWNPICSATLKSSG